MKAATIFILLLALTACASNSDIDILRRDTDNLRRDSSESKKEISSLKENAAKAAREESFTALRESQAETTARISELASGLQELRGRFEESKYYQEKILKDSATEKDILRAQISGMELQLKTLKDRFASLEEAVKTREPARTDTEKPALDNVDDSNSDRTAEKKDDADDKARSYESAYQSFRDKKYREARGKFEAFVKDSPKNRLAGNAQFWIAETYYAEKDYESAILAYETLLKKYPDSEKISGALLKQGFAFVEIGDKKTAKAILDKLVQKYPESKDAGLAKKKLAEIEKKPGRKK